MKTKLMDAGVIIVLILFISLAGVLIDYDWGQAG